MNIEAVMEIIRSSGLVGIAIAGGAALVLGTILGVLVMARRSSGGGGERRAALDDALAATGAATIGLRLRGERLEMTRISESISSLTGYTSAALIQGDAFWRMLNQHDANQLERKIVSAIRDERATVADFTYRDADGRTRWMQLRAEPAEGSKGSALRGIVRETTESRILQHEVSTASSRFHALADATPAMLWVLDSTGAATAVNRATERFCGVSEAALLGTGWMLAVDEEHHVGLQQFVERVIDEGMSLNREVVMIDPDNRERRIAMTATVAKNSDGAVGSVVLTGRDVTDRSEAEKQRERLTRLIDSIESPSMILAPDLRVTMMNPAARSLAGLADGESADSIALWHVVTQEAVNKIRGEAARYCRDGGVFHTRASIRDGSDGSLSAEFAVVGLGDDWLGVSVRVIEQDLAREAKVAEGRRQVEVVDTAMRLLGEGASDRLGMASRVCHAIAESFPNLRASFSIETEPGVIECEASDGNAEMGSSNGRVIRFDTEGSVLRSIREGEVVTVGDVWAETQLADSLLELESTATRSLTLCRVNLDGGPLGVLSLERHEIGRYSEQELRALSWSARLLELALSGAAERECRQAAEAESGRQAELADRERARADEMAAASAQNEIAAREAAGKLQQAAGTWSKALVRLSEQVSAANELSAEAREAGLGSLADSLSRLAFEAERSEAAGRVAAGTLEPSTAMVRPRDVLRTVGERVLHEARGKGVALRISKEGQLPATIGTDERLLSVAGAELLTFAVERCSSREVRAIVRPDGEDGLSLTVTSGPVAKSAEHGVPRGLNLLRELAIALGGSLETDGRDGSTTVILRVANLDVTSGAAAPPAIAAGTLVEGIDLGDDAEDATGERSAA